MSTLTEITPDIEKQMRVVLQGFWDAFERDDRKPVSERARGVVPYVGNRLKPVKETQERRSCREYLERHPMASNGEVMQAISVSLTLVKDVRRAMGIARPAFGGKRADKGED
jgi:hypothetical protein